MSIPRGSLYFGHQCQAPETRPTQGRCPEHSHEAAYAIEVVRQRLIAESKKAKSFTIKTPAPKEITE